jgi:hypothetical protein
LRAVTLADPKVSKLLEKNFICSWENIKGKRPYAGSSNTHFPSYAATEVNNGAGHHNVQMFFINADGKVVHCLPGFWLPEIFVEEAQLALKLDALYQKAKKHPKTLSFSARNASFLDLHLNQMILYSEEMMKRSELVGFDAHDLKSRCKEGDFERKEGYAPNTMKSMVQVVHERMAERPYLPLEAFDVESFIDMGQKEYSYSFGIPEKPIKNKRR